MENSEQILDDKDLGFQPLISEVNRQERLYNFRNSCDDLGMSFVGWNQNNLITGCLNEYFSPKTIEIIQNKVTELTMGIDPDNRPIIVPEKTICSVMSEVFRYNRPKTGDIYTRYTIPDPGPHNVVQEMINKVIQIIYADIKANIGMAVNNSKLSIWNSVLGEFNVAGLQAVPRGFAKLNRRRNTKALFNMNY